MTVLVVPFPPKARRDAVLAALGVDEATADPVEIGRPATGATCMVVDAEIHVPLIRTPTSAFDLIPAIAAALDEDRDALIARWQQAHVDACRSLMEACVAAGAPPPPHLPRATLDALHGWLVAASTTADAAYPIVGVASPTGDVVIAAPRQGLVPPVQAVLVDGALRALARPLQTFTPAADVELGEALPMGRVIACVEIVDDESLFATG